MDTPHSYRIAGFICEVLICANYARCCRLAEFNSTVTLILSFQLLLSLLLSSPEKHNKLQISFWARVPLQSSPYILQQQKDRGGCVHHGDRTALLRPNILVLACKRDIL